MLEGVHLCAIRRPSGPRRGYKRIKGIKAQGAMSPEKDISPGVVIVVVVQVAVQVVPREGTRDIIACGHAWGRR